MYELITEIEWTNQNARNAISEVENVIKTDIHDLIFFSTQKGPSIHLIRADSFKGWYIAMLSYCILHLIYMMRDGQFRFPRDAWSQKKSAWFGIGTPFPLPPYLKVYNFFQSYSFYDLFFLYFKTPSSLVWIFCLFLEKIVTCCLQEENIYL